MSSSKDIYVFENKKYPKQYTFENVTFVIKKYRQPSRLVGGEFKEKLYNELLSKPKLRKGLVFYGVKNAYQLVEFDYSKWNKGEYLKDEMLTIVLEHSREYTEKMIKLKEKDNSKKL